MTSPSAAPEPSVLGDIALFQRLAPRDLSVLSQELRRRTFPPNSNIMTAEAPAEALFIILRGTVKVVAEQADGSEVLLALLGGGEIVGEMSVTDGLGRSATIVTLEESTVAWINRATFTEYLHSMPGLAFNLARILSARLRLANAQIQSLATQDVYGRVARQLLALARVYGQEVEGGGIFIPLRLTQSELASLVGASRVRVNQALVTYKELGYISLEHDNRLTVRNPTALAQRCA
jgi:CRP/FNR family transcriptional regulator, cyclic AMP receptor protein